MKIIVKYHLLIIKEIYTFVLTERGCETLKNRIV